MVFLLRLSLKEMRNSLKSSLFRMKSRIHLFVYIFDRFALQSQHLLKIKIE